MSITVYALSTCPWCSRTKEFFARQGIPFNYVDYDLADDATQAKVMDDLDSYGVSGFPVVRIGNEIVMGYQPDRFAELLRAEGWR